MKKIAVLLNGCGHRDGSEIHEAVLTLLGIEEAGARWEALAVNKSQAKVINHLDGSVESGSAERNMLKESARIARGRIKDLSAVNPGDYDGIIIPGGSGTASNLCDFASKGIKMHVLPEVVRFLELAHEKQKPIGAVCISPIMIASIFGKKGVRLTLGSAVCDAAKVALEMGADVVDCRAEDCVVDDRLLIVTTPAYMADAGVAEIAQGIRKLTKEVLRLS